MDESRRAFLWRAGALAAPLLFSRPIRAAEAAVQVSVRSHGAKGDGRAKDTRAIQAAIDAAGRSRGTVYFPPGEYVSGTLRLRSHVTLRLDADATLIASKDTADFDPYERLPYDTFADRETSDFGHALLRGRGLERVAIRGPGRIAGNRTSRDGPKPIALKECRGIDIRDLTIADAGNYNISLLGCDHVQIQGVTIRNGYSDGIDPDCCRNVRIVDCDIESRDDAVCLKTSLALGVRRSTENVVVTRCSLTTLHNALKLGTESSGNFRNIGFSNCRIVGRPHAWKGELSSGIALETVDGGRIENVVVSNIRMTTVRAPIFVRLARRGRGQPVPTAGTLSNVTIWDVVATGATLASSITGIVGHPVSGISLKDIRIMARGGGTPELMSRSVPEFEKRYPDATMFSDLPAYGLYCRRVAELTLHRIDLGVDRSDARPAIVLDDVRDADVRTVQAMTPSDGEPLLWLHAVRGGRFNGIRPRSGTGALVRLSGAATAEIHLARRDFAEQTMAVVDADVPATALRWIDV
jgi:hypothetical protein